MRVLRRGFHPKVVHSPPLNLVPIPFLPPASAIQRETLEEEVKSMLQKQATQGVTDGSLGFYSRIFLVPKASGGWRPVIVLSALNMYLIAPYFNRETVEAIRMVLQQDSWVISLDLKDAYFHVLIRPSFRKYLSSVDLYDDCEEVQLMVQTRGFTVHQYLDVWFLRSSSPGEPLEQRDEVLQWVSDLGFIFNKGRS